MKSDSSIWHHKITADGKIEGFPIVLHETEEECMQKIDAYGRKVRKDNYDCREIVYKSCTSLFSVCHSS